MTKRTEIEPGNRDVPKINVDGATPVKGGRRRDRNRNLIHIHGNPTINIPGEDPEVQRSREKEEQFLGPGNRNRNDEKRNLDAIDYAWLWASEMNVQPGNQSDFIAAVQSHIERHGVNNSQSFALDLAQKYRHASFAESSPHRSSKHLGCLVPIGIAGMIGIVAAFASYDPSPSSHEALSGQNTQSVPHTETYSSPNSYNSFGGASSSGVDNTLCLVPLVLTAGGVIIGSTLLKRRDSEEE